MYSQQFTYGAVREGIIAENLPQISAEFPDTIKRIFYCANFRDLSAEFRKKKKKNLR